MISQPIALAIAPPLAAKSFCPVRLRLLATVRLATPALAIFFKQLLRDHEPIRGHGKKTRKQITQSHAGRDRGLHFGVTK